eukprot:TRINITY_DN406_c0_g1_i1.p2 TRINITY_DN406_c0_g1~~TRINITY_DN406_c0_g1_i1.p2  ORF type:complete len:121 (+),score=25.43 TRINITY_DN406_c0_g1_i1:77-439(+)
MNSACRARRSSSLLCGAVALTAATYSALNVAFSLLPGHPEEAAGRRQTLANSAAVVAATAASAPALAAELPFLGRQRGPFEMDPKEAVIVADSTTDAVKAARAKVQALQGRGCGREAREG